MQGGDKVDWELLQATFATGSPVLAIGPGCHRIGYDDTDEWKHVVKRVGMIWHCLAELNGEDVTEEEQAERVEARRNFLTRFWAAQLRDKSPPSASANGNQPTVETSLDPDLDIRGRPREDFGKERARILLATELLCALVSTTRLLGSTITAGATPVTDWEVLGANQDSDEEDRRRFRAEAIAWLREAEGLAGFLVEVRDAPDSERGALTYRGLKGADVDRESLKLLKAAAIQSGLLDLIEKRFEAGAEQVSGAVVEWLSDLFWHVVVSGAGVPPSQGELSFYLNLHQLEDSRRRFTRPHPGEYRSLKKEKGAKKDLRGDLKTLLGDYDAGEDERERDWRRPREAFALTMAASLVEAWRAEQGPRHSIALVSDYDLMFERAALELLGRSEKLHVIVPAVPDSSGEDGKSSFVWLFGTYEGGLEGRGGELQEPSWRRLDKLTPEAVPRPLGPIVIRLTGSPLFGLGTVEALGLSEDFAPETRLDPAAVFSEHDSVQAVMALTPPALPGQQTEHLFVDELFGTLGLTWDKRCWLFFGHRFSDWLPRLQLLFTALMLAVERSTVEGKAKERKKRLLVDAGQPREIPEVCWIATSRHFDWPEQALLDALRVEMYREDLQGLSAYYAIPRDHPEATARFLANVKQTVDSFQGNGAP